MNNNYTTNVYLDFMENKINKCCEKTCMDSFNQCIPRSYKTKNYLIFTIDATNFNNLHKKYFPMLQEKYEALEIPLYLIDESEETVCKILISEHKSDIIECKSDTSDHKLDTSDHKLDTSDHKLDTSDHKLDISDHKLDTSDHKLDIIECKSDTSDHKLDTSDHKLDTSDHKPILNIDDIKIMFENVYTEYMEAKIMNLLQSFKYSIRSYLCIDNEDFMDFIDLKNNNELNKYKDLIGFMHLHYIQPIEDVNHGKFFKKLQEKYVTQDPPIYLIDESDSDDIKIFITHDYIPNTFYKHSLNIIDSVLEHKVAMKEIRKQNMNDLVSSIERMIDIKKKEENSNIKEECNTFDNILYKMNPIDQKAIHGFIDDVKS
jgi:hypothetical protein